jgi:hypothetical protein
MSLSRRGNKLLARPWADRWLLLKAFFWLGLMRLAILLLPFRRVARMIGLHQGENSAVPDLAQAEEAERVGWAIRAAAKRTPWDSACLAQALSGSILLRRKAIPATVYLGVAKEKDMPEQVAAHAWLRCGENILTGGGVHERFSVISTFSIKSNDQ